MKYYLLLYILYVSLYLTFFILYKTLKKENDKISSNEQALNREKGDLTKIYNDLQVHDIF